MLPVTLVGSLYKTHAVLCSKIADMHGVEVHDFRTWKFVHFRNIFLFLSHITIVYPKSRNLVTTYPPISGKLSITNYLKQNAIDCWSHMTIENNLKVEISAFISKTSTTLPREKNAWGTRSGVGRGPFPQNV